MKLKPTTTARNPSHSQARRPVAKSPHIEPDHAPENSEVVLYRQALERARQDLQTFAHSVSHDLRAPLRAIQGFSKILLEDFSTELSGEARQFLDHIVQNTQHLSGQMDDLLRFSRAGKNAPSRIPLDGSKLLAEVLEQLQPDLPPHVRIVAEPLPEIFADPGLLRQALSELVVNAAKFAAKTPEPHIRISSKKDANAVTIEVSDNGVGFEPAHSGKLFQVFQKLHSPGEFDGNGIGLAIVKRIAEAHGGCVEAAATPHQGARFSISLPHATSEIPLICPPPAPPA